MKARARIAICLLGLCQLLNPNLTAQDVGKGRDLRGKQLQNRDLRREDLDGANLEGANLTAADMTDAVMKKANLKDANLSRAKLGGADLTGADLRGAILDSAFMQNANLSQANLEGLDLKGISHYGCNLRGAILRNTKGWWDIRGADLRDADLRGAYLITVHASYSEKVNLLGAKYDKLTRWPKGFDVEGSGAKLGESVAEPAKNPTAPATDNPPTKKKKKKGKNATPPPQADTAKPAATPTPAAKVLDPGRPAAAPTEAEVKAAFEKQWTKTQVAKNTFTYQSMKFGPPREGDALQDGTPANLRTIVYPVEVTCEQVIESNDGTTQTIVRTQTFRFFKTETGGWTSTATLHR